MRQNPPFLTTGAGGGEGDWMDFGNGTTFVLFKYKCECGQFQSISVGRIYLNLNKCFLFNYSLEIRFLKEIKLSTHSKKIQITP